MTTADIKQYLEKIYKVPVLSVRTMRQKRKFTVYFAWHQHTFLSELIALCRTSKILFSQSQTDIVPYFYFSGRSVSSN